MFFKVIYLFFNIGAISDLYALGCQQCSDIKGIEHCNSFTGRDGPCTWQNNGCSSNETKCQSTSQLECSPTNGCTLVGNSCTTLNLLLPCASLNTSILCSNPHRQCLWFNYSTATSPALQMIGAECVNLTSPVPNMNCQFLEPSSCNKAASCYLNQYNRCVSRTIHFDCSFITNQYTCQNAPCIWTHQSCSIDASVKTPIQQTGTGCSYFNSSYLCQASESVDCRWSVPQSRCYSTSSGMDCPQYLDQTSCLGSTYRCFWSTKETNDTTFPSVCQYQSCDQLTPSTCLPFQTYNGTKTCYLNEQKKCVEGLPSDLNQRQCSSTNYGTPYTWDGKTCFECGQPENRSSPALSISNADVTHYLPIVTALVLVWG